jgi:hypothetical protein
VREEASAVFVQQAHAGIVHPVATRPRIRLRVSHLDFGFARKVVANDVEDRRLDLDAVEALDRVKEESTGRLPRPHIHDEDAACVWMQKHGEVCGHPLVPRGPLILPPPIDLEAECALVTHGGDVAAQALRKARAGGGRRNLWDPPARFCRTIGA